MDPHRSKATGFWQEDAVGTTAGVTTTHAAVTGRRHCVEHVSGSGDAAALVTIESPASTILWRKRFAAAFTFSESFAPGQLVGAVNSAVLVKISASTANSEANIHGYEFQG